MSEVLGLPTWRAAWTDALYGASGFYRRHRPAAHFRTSAHVGTAFAAAVARLARDLGATRVVDLGTGSGELLTAISLVDPGLDLVGVELRPRPPGLPERIAWTDALPDRVDGLVVANEWLDTVPCDVVEVDAAGVARVVHVDRRTGHEQPGAVVAAAEAAWLERWWPLGRPVATPGARAEVGLPRDEAWADVVRRIGRGAVLAVDYAHDAATRPDGGSLSAYREGRAVPVVLDGSCDVTAAVALDAVAAAGERAGARTVARTTQAEALRALEVTANRPSIALAAMDPVAYVRRLAEHGDVAALLDPQGLGGFGWLLQLIGPDGA